MSHETDEFWERAVKNLARRSGHAPLTPEQARKECDSLPEIKLSETEINSIIGQVTSGELAVWAPTPMEVESPGADSEGIEEDVLQLNRNEGQTDTETDELLKELRCKALGDGEFNGQADSTRLEGDAESPASGS